MVWEPQAAGLAADLTPALSLITTVAVVAFGGLATWLVARRRSSGKIGTSEAGELWGESRAMRDTLTAQLEKAEAQRDRLIEAQAGQVLPMMAAVNQSMQTLATSIETVIGQDEADREHAHLMYQLLVEIRDGQAHQPAAASEREGEGRGDRRPARRSRTPHGPAAGNSGADQRDGADPQESDPER